MIELEKQDREAQTANPVFTILFGKPKCGKTTLIAGLQDALIIDMDPSKGTDSVELHKSTAIKVSNMTELEELRQSVVAKNKSIGDYYFTYGIFDTATDLEEITLPYALSMYKKTPMGKTFKGTDIRTLPNGGGYMYIREAYKKVINLFRPLFKYLILTGHVKDKNIDKEGKEVTEYSLDLAGKLARIMIAQADAVGFVYRKKNQTIVNFNGGGDFIAEARPKHLRGKEIVLGDSDEDNVVTTYWDRIFI